MRYFSIILFIIFSNFQVVAGLNYIQSDTVNQNLSDKAKLSFFTGISHEFRTPLTLIQSPLETLIKKQSENSETKNVYELMLSNTNKLKNLINQILDLRKLDDNELQINIQNLDVVKYVNDLINSFEHYCNKYNCNLYYNSNYSSAYISFDFQKFEIMLSNLISNAFKYNVDNGDIIITLVITDKIMKIEVKDTGIGIPDEAQNEIFNRYSRLTEYYDYREGSGIGLAYVKEMAELLNGSLSLESKHHQGSVFSLNFNIGYAKIVNEKPCSLQIKSNNAVKNIDYINNTTNDKEHTLLLVDDNEELINYMHSIFINNYNILIAKNGNEAIQIAESEIPDLIISDVMMPEMDGFELCTLLKNNRITNHIPVILLSAKNNNKAIIDGYNTGADDYISKPFNSDILELKVQNLLILKEKLRNKFSFNIDTEKTIYKNSDQEFINNCIEIINKNIQNPAFTAIKLSDELNLTQRTFYRKIKALTNKTPGDFVKSYKMEFAALLLKKQNLKIYEVASEVGYEDVVSFSNTFKKYHGELPSKFN